MNKKILIPLIVVILALLGGVVYLSMNLKEQKQVNADMQELAALDKQEMENEYERFTPSAAPPLRLDYGLRVFPTLMV